MIVKKFEKGLDIYELGDGYSLRRGDKHIFAVYQTIYSDADIEQWHDWNYRLNDTTWSDNCFFLYKGTEKVGGAIIQSNLIMFGFLIPPFCDRDKFYQLLNQVLIEWSSPEKAISAKGILPKDVDSLQALGYRVKCVRKIMIRPTDVFDIVWDPRFTIKTPTKENAKDVANVLFNSFKGGIAWEVFGEQSIDECENDFLRVIKMYESGGAPDVSVLVFDNEKKQFVGTCISGIYPQRPNNFCEIYDVAVIPEYRGFGLAKKMLQYVITTAEKYSPAIYLHMVVGNSAETVYKKTGFVSGPKFTDMYYEMKK